MEERIIDKDELRKIKVKRNAVGGIEDVTDEIASEDEVTLEVEEEIEIQELEEDLIGLAPSELEREFERREKAIQEARAERDRLLSEAESLLAKKKYEEAEPFFSQTLLYDADCARAKEGVWLCRTEGFEDFEAFYEKKNAEEFSKLDDKTKALVRKRVGEKLKADRAEYEAEAEPLIESFGRAQEERRSAFRANRNYYLMRFSVSAIGFLLFLLGAGISAWFIVRSNTMIPIYLTIVFGVLAFIAVGVAVVYSRKLLVAQRLCRENEKPDSTDEGARLAYLKERLECLALVLDDEE